MEPDLIVSAKSMGGGLPIAAVTGRAEIMDNTGPGSLGGTFGGNPLSCKAALAAIRAIEQNRLNERAPHSASDLECERSSGGSASASSRMYAG